MTFKKSEKTSGKSKKKTKPVTAKNSLMRFIESDSEKNLKKSTKKEQVADFSSEKLPEKEKQLEKLQQMVEQKKKQDVPQKKTLSSQPNSVETLKKSDLTFYKKDTTPFGEQRFENPVEDRKGAAKAVYVENLIQNGEICSHMEQGILLTVEYSGKQNKAYARFYDINEKIIKFWIDNTNHRPYALHKEKKEKLEQIPELVNFSGFDGIETVEIEDLLHDEKIMVSKIYGKTPNDIGKKGDIQNDDPMTLSPNSIFNILARAGYNGAWEANIRYHHNYIYDRDLIPGLIYQIKDGSISPMELHTTPDLEKKLLKLFANEPEVFQEMARRYMKVFSYPIPDVRRVAFDIEVEVPKTGNLPEALIARERVTSISFAGSDGMNRVYVLWRDEVPIGTIIDEFPENAEIIYFEEEKDLITECFRILWNYPLVVSFNGDNFDLNYLFHRAKNLDLPNEINPIEIKRQGGLSLVDTNAFLKHSIHLDLYQIFANRSLKGYAFGEIYERNSLDDISKAFLGSEKIKHGTGEKFSPIDIATMELNTLAYYNMIDSVLTLELTQFGGNTVWNLLVYLMRITKLPLQDLFRHQISVWVRNIFYYEHRIRGYLIPRKSELAELKPGMGDEFEGGFVFDPVPGIHFNVSVMDFSSLYPTIIKSRNLSYETVNCFHPECQSNLLPNVPYHICSKRLGIFTIIVGFFRDVRVRWYKPRSLDKEVSPEERNFAKILQSALKVFLNSIYGVLGSVPFVLRCKPVAESTTAIGRYSIQQTARRAKEINIQVLYGDTDSVFLHSPSKEQIKEMAQWSKKKLDLDLEEEKVYQFLALSQRKKNYVGVYKGGNSIDVKGMSAKKSNTPPFIFKAFDEISGILKKITSKAEFEKEKAKIINITKSYLKRIGKSLEKNGFPIEDYAISTKLTKSISSYKKTMPQHVKAAMMEEKRTGIKIEAGEYISYVKTRDSEHVKPVSLASIQDIDVKKYQENLQNVLEQLLDALDINWEEIKGTKKLDAFGL
ncbi:MAG: DNA-directed DNA polymerase I [Candidatus Lokiarchaeota archaeon]|nr:DNA-directed DNA polymerase I [Candidatus Lokiarchaeota archaeon]